MVSHLDCDMHSVRLGFFDMLVPSVAEAPAKIPTDRAMLEPRYHVVPHPEGGGATQIIPNGVLMVDADLRRMVASNRLGLFWRSCDVES